MNLFNGKVGETYTISDIKLDNKIKRRLEVLGFTNGTLINILNKNFNGALILKIRGARFAISSKISQGIEVEGGKNIGKGNKSSIYR